MNPRRWLGLATFVGAFAIPVVVAVQSDSRRADASATGSRWGATRATHDSPAWNRLPPGTSRPSGRVDVAKIRRISVHPGDARRQGWRDVRHGAAVDLRIGCEDGATIWRFQAAAARGGRRGRRAKSLGHSGSGKAWPSGRPVSSASDARVIALHEKTGELVWNEYVGDKARDKGQVISGAPVYAGGIVSVGLSADNGWRGQIVALDAKTGQARRGASSPCRAPGKRDTSRGRRRTTHGNAAAAPSGSSARPMPDAGLRLLCDRQRRPPARRASSAPATTCISARSSRWT